MIGLLKDMKMVDIYKYYYPYALDIANENYFDPEQASPPVSFVNIIKAPFAGKGCCLSLSLCH